jgi:hypothetical protein
MIATSSSSPAIAKKGMWTSYAEHREQPLSDVRASRVAAVWWAVSIDLQGIRDDSDAFATLERTNVPDALRSLEFRSTAGVVGVMASVWAPTPECARDALLAAIGTAFAYNVRALRWVARWEGDANVGPANPPTDSAPQRPGPRPRSPGGNVMRHDP